MLNLKDVIEQVLRKATLHRKHSVPVFTLEAGKEVSRASFQFEVSAESSDKYTVQYVNDKSKSATAVSMGIVLARAGMISGTAFAKTQYTNVTQDPFFELLYDVKVRALTYIEAGTECSKPVSSAPCMMCGIVLPLRNLTVDHQRPQSGGATEAVIKTFRAFGCTNEGPKGEKGKRILNHVTNGALVQPVMPQLGRTAVASGISLHDRYTLNDLGTILYSFVVDAEKKSDLQNQCMHGLLNLKPLCQVCNSSRGKQLKFV